MMAAEATSEKPVDVSVTDASLSQTTASTEPDLQNHEASNSPTVNGTVSPDGPEKNKTVIDIAEDAINSASVSVSGGSDTEASTAKAKDPNHVRTSSTVKKPQSFKSVSVNRSFLGAKNAASATSRSETSSPALTPAAPATTAGSSASKLKLVAKSGSSLGGASKTLTSNSKAPGPPDGSTVWNRNQPVPVPEPKKFTDEELTSKYGIHLAERMKPEDLSGQGRWADEDDDADWSAEPITWNDGTKVTLTPMAVPAVHEPVVAPVPVPAPIQAPVPIEKPKSPAPGVISGSATASPSVKPSLVASGPKSLVLKGAPEKPTLVAKTPALSNTVKSPWAQLPPVEKASPVLMEIPNPQQAPPLRGYPPRDPSLAKSATPPPTKEIAADDFSRSAWRDSHAGGNRELYNSQSGRYEPVHDRRGSRHDANHRHPALLQRPPHSQDQQGPAEPSAAFQTRNSGQDGMPYGRRRNSSNVSGGSGGLMHRLGRPHDMALPEPDAPAAGQPSPARSQHAQPWQPQASPGQSHAAPENIQPPVDTTTDNAAAVNPSENDIELQKRLMRERRELAIKRRLEEEAKEEAARKERIRLKLEAMGPAPERKSTKKEEPKEVPYKREGPPAGVFSKEDLAAAAAERDAPLPVTSPEKQEALTSKSHSKANGVHSGPTQSEKSQTESTRAGEPSDTQASAPWPDTAQKPAERLPSWNSGSQQGSKNVWAAPGNDRSLGNGTFAADLGQLADSEPAQPASSTSRPTPIGPPRSTSHGQSQRGEPQTRQLAPIGPPSISRSGAQLPPVGAPRRNPWASADIAADDRAIRADKQKQLDEYRKTMESQGINANEDHHTVRDTWRGVAVGPDGQRIPTQGMTTQHSERVERVAAPSWNAPAPSSRHEPPRPDAQQLRQPPHQQDYRQQRGGPDGIYSRAPPMPSAGSAAPGLPAVQPRAGSRFFPNSGSRDIRFEEALVQPRSKSPTPPPPTMDGHPAYDGDVERPHVALPPTRPIVKLPPAAVRMPPPPKQAPAPVVPPKPVSFAAAAAAAAARPPSRGVNYGGNMQSAGEIKKQENWQEKINSLVRAHPKPMTVDSSSKYAFDGHANTSATVSLPALSPTGSSSSESSAITTKEMAEECFDEQEMGSLPLVNLPNEAPSALWSTRAAELNWHPLHAKYRIEAMGSESVRFPYEVVNHKSVYRVLTPGMDEAKTISAPYSPRNRSNPRRQGRGGRHGSRGGQRGGRDSFGDHQNTSSGLERPDRPDRPERTSSRGSRGSFRARSENWSRTPSTLAQPTQS